MFGSLSPAEPAGRRLRRRAALFLRNLLLIALLLVQPAWSGPAAAAEGPSGLPLPRFATTRSTPINVRVGPGIKYGVAWVYVKAGTPVEIVQEFDTWRKIRDVDGSEGWVHQNLLSGKRAGLAAPWRSGEQIPLYASRNPDSGVRAWLGPGFRVEISGCDGAWCEVSATTHPEGGSAATYTGFMQQTELWGVYEGEEFD